MSTAVEEIVKQIHSLPFVERRQIREILIQEEEDIEKERTRRIDLAKKIRGKYAHLQTSSEDFARRKQEEIETEGVSGEWVRS